MLIFLSSLSSSKYSPVCWCRRAGAEGTLKIIAGGSAWQPGSQFRPCESSPASDSPAWLPGRPRGGRCNRDPFPTWKPGPGLSHQQSGQCIYITNMQNLNIALFYILFLELAYYFAYCKICMQNNMYNMQNNMQKNSAMFRFCIFQYSNMQNMQNMSNNMLQYAKQYAKYAKQYAKK